MLEILNKESHRGAVLIACSYLDNQLQAIIAAFLLTGANADKLLDGFNAPLGTFSARIAAASALGLLRPAEGRECELLRKIRNEFAHKVDANFDDPKIVALTTELKYAAQDYNNVVMAPFGRFNTAAVGLILSLTNRAHYVGQKRLVSQEWPT